MIIFLAIRLSLFILFCKLIWQACDYNDKRKFFGRLIPVDVVLCSLLTLVITGIFWTGLLLEYLK